MAGPMGPAASGTVPATTPRACTPGSPNRRARVRFGVLGGPAAEWGALVGWVQTIERLGFNSFWTGDHPMRGAIDCWMALAILAGRTERLRLGTLVSCVYYRSAGLLARQAADVDRLSGARPRPRRR